MCVCVEGVDCGGGEGGGGECVCVCVEGVDCGGGEGGGECVCVCVLRGLTVGVVGGGGGGNDRAEVE